MKQDIGHYIKIGIIASQQNQTMHLQQVRLLRSLPIPTQYWESEIMDFMMSLLESIGLNAIYVLVDRFWKMANIAPTWNTAMVQEIARYLFKLVVKHYKLQKDIVSNKD
jgi:hypothetical protein